MKPTDFAIRLTSFLGEYLSTQKNVSPNTIKAYRRCFYVVIALLPGPFGGIAGDFNA